MGQYHKVVNLDKREYVHPHVLACGLKLWEQLATHPGTGAALIVLLASHSNGEGGGDLAEDAIVGSWCGDRIAFVGDYDDASYYQVGDKLMAGVEIYNACDKEVPDHWIDVSEPVCAIIEKELEGKFVGEGWRGFVKAEDDGAGFMTIAQVID
jgi:hypothetical protein